MTRSAFVTGMLPAAGNTVPVISTRLSLMDRLGGWLVRWDIGRGSYRVTPGLYAVGAPGPESPVLVTANYKLTFDALRRELEGIDTWILVLDTRGVNVWCSAGKGTFGTRELERMLVAARMDQVVSHRTLILPQLAASGVAGYEVRRDAGWTVRFGPVRARDIRAYLAAGMRKDDAMRRVEFRAADRMAIAPTELAHAWPFIVGVLAAGALLGLPFEPGWLTRAARFAVPLLGAVLVATLAFPALLPWLPLRAFALKGAVLGAAWSVASGLAAGGGVPDALARGLITTAMVSFMTMSFTGSSTFTCQPGAALEVRRGLAPMIAGAALGIALSALLRILAVTGGSS
jgi:hypothetical protein